MMKSIRINPEKEEELLEFFDKHGLKNGINKLWEFYKTYNQLEPVIKTTITEALGSMKIVASQPFKGISEGKDTNQEVSRTGMALFGAMKAK